MKKDIEWLKSAIQQNLDFYNDKDEEWQMAKVRAYAKSLDLINQLDEPEVLSQEWIDEHIDYADVGGDTSVYTCRRLKSLLVPKQELPVIPKYVADFIKVRKYTDAYSLQYIFRIAMERSEAKQLKKEYDWIRQNDETFARAWLDGYEVEEEPKYYVNLDMAAYVAKWNVNDEVDIHTDAVAISDNYEFYLTEQEIKNYDERFWAFAEPVEEAEEEPRYHALIKGYEMLNINGIYWAYDKDNGDMFFSECNPPDDNFITEMSKEEWSELGINDSNADFVRVEEME